MTLRQLLMLAVLEGYGFRCQTGKDKLLLISLGTGTYKKTFTSEELGRMVAAEQAVRSLQSLMDDCARLNHCMLQWLTHCVTPWQIDRAMLTMEGDSKSGPQLATYARYNVLLEPGWMKTEVDIEQMPVELAKIAEMDIPRTLMNSLALERLPRRSR